MASIVEYTDKKPPENGYPRYIVSPPRSGSCCFSEMEELGECLREGEWEYVYKRCRTCGFAVRLIGRAVPDEALLTGLRKILKVAFQRNVPVF